MIIAMEIQGLSKNGQELYLFLSSKITMMIGRLLKDGIEGGVDITLDPNFYFSNQDVETVQLYTVKGVGGDQGNYNHSFEARIQMKSDNALSMTRRKVRLMYYNYLGEFHKLSTMAMQPFSRITLLDLTDNLKTLSVYGYNRSLGKEIVTRSGVFSHATHGVAIYDYQPQIKDYRDEGKNFIGREPLQPYISHLKMNGFTKGIYICEECGHKRNFTTPNLGVVRGRCEGCKEIKGSQEPIIQTFVPLALASMFYEYNGLGTKEVIDMYLGQCKEWAESVQLIA